MTEQLSKFEIVDIEGFAERMGVGRTTVFGWIKNGTLQIPDRPGSGMNWDEKAVAKFLC